MKERDLEAEEPAAGPLVDELDAVARQAVELGPDVGDLERDVVHPGTALGEEPPHRRVGAEGGQELDPPVSDPERGRLDSLLDEPLAVLELRAEQAAVGRDRGVQILDGDPDVVDAGHVTDAIRAGTSECER